MFDTPALRRPSRSTPRSEPCIRYVCNDTFWLEREGQKVRVSVEAMRFLGQWLTPVEAYDLLRLLSKERFFSLCSILGAAWYEGDHVMPNLIGGRRIAS